MDESIICAGNLTDPVGICQGKDNLNTGRNSAAPLTILMSGSSHIRFVLIGVEYRNCCRTLDVYLLFAIWMGQIQSKLIYIFVTYGLASL